MASTERIALKPADPERLETWHRYQARLCDTCHATCCTLPVEVGFDDLVRLGFADPFEREEPVKKLAKRLEKAGITQHLHHKSARFTLAQRSNGDCSLLDAQSRRCTVYARRPETCRAHPQVGPKPGYCAWRPR